MWTSHIKFFIIIQDKQIPIVNIFKYKVAIFLWMKSFSFRRSNTCYWSFHSLTISTNMVCAAMLYYTNLCCFWMVSSIYSVTRGSLGSRLVECRAAWVIYNVLKVTIKFGTDLTSEHAAVYLIYFDKAVVFSGHALLAHNTLESHSLKWKELCAYASSAVYLSSVFWG